MGSIAWYQQPHVEPWFVTVAAVASLGMLLDAWRRLRDTTLAAPIVWGCFAAIACVVAAWRGSAEWEYATAVLFVSPTLAALGAKRPQNAAWQFIVLTLVGVLMVPLVQGWAYGADTPQVHALFRWLLAAHVLIGLANYLPSRNAVPAIIFAAAQTAIAGNYFPVPFWLQHSQTLLAASGGLAAALAYYYYLARQTPASPLGLNCLWRDFRDAYGAVWALRVAERLNASAKQHGWPIELAWSGILVQGQASAMTADDSVLAALNPQVRHRVERELRSLLRRFVSHDWIARRLPAAKSAP